MMVGKPFPKGNIPWNLGKQHSAESIEKMRGPRRKGRISWNKGMKYEDGVGNKGKHPSVETRKKMSASRMGKKVSEEAKKKTSDRFKGKPLSEEHKDKIRNALIGKPLTEERKDNIGKGRKGILASDETKRKQSIVRKGRIVPEATKKKMSKAGKDVWINATEESRKARMKMLLTLPSPNKQEIKLMELLDSLYPGEWKFVGDGTVFINGKCPDYININGQKKLIELFGDYWHKGDNPQDRIDVFRPFGFDTLVIWERELKNIDSIRNRIREFHESKHEEVVA